MADYLTEGLEPKRTLQIFEEICRIPHGSGNEEALAKYIMGIAKKNSMHAEQDVYGNVLVEVAASEGCEDAPCMLMQGHMDMVCVKEPWVKKDLEKDPITLIRDGNILYAEGTSLGADNAVGICNMLAIMEDITVIRPPMQMLFTVREEVGLEGIKQFDMSKIKAKYMLTMDCGDPDVLVLGSAGSVTYRFEETFDTVTETNEKQFVIEVKGLHGGHSGIEIGKGYANALNIVTTILTHLKNEFDFGICDIAINSGKTPSIPTHATARISVPEERGLQVEETVKHYLDVFAREYAYTEDNMQIHVYENKENSKCLSKDNSARMIDFLLFCREGVVRRHPYNEKQVMASALIREIELRDGKLLGKYSIRSNTDEYKNVLDNAFKRLCKSCEIHCIKERDDPAWPEKKDSELVRVAEKVYFECFGSMPKKELIHGGEEASIVSYNIPDIDIIGIAPFSRGAHTTKEKLDLNSMLPVWKFLVALLKRLSETR